MASPAVERARREASQVAQGASRAIEISREAANTAKLKARELNRQLEELREEPFIDAGVGVAAAGITGSALAMANEMIGPIFELAADVDTAGNPIEGTGYQFGLEGPAAAALTILGVMEKSKTMLDAGKGAAAVFAYTTTQQFYKKAWK